MGRKKRWYLIFDEPVEEKVRDFEEEYGGEGGIWARGERVYGEPCLISSFARHLGVWPDTVIFDLDGTLIESKEYHASIFAAWMRKRGKRISLRTVLPLIGLPAVEIARRLGLRKREVEELREFHREMELLGVENIRPVEWASLFLKLPYKKAIISNGSREFVEAVVKRFGWRVNLILAGDIPHKPDPTGISRVLEVLGGPAVYIGDHRVDREAAENAGIPSLIRGRDFRDYSDLLPLFSPCL